MHGGPKLVQDTTVEHPSGAGAEPRFDWANRMMGEVRDHLLHCALRHVRSQEVAEELAQAIIAKLWIDDGEDMRWYDEERFKAFLGTVVRRRVVDLRRRMQVRETYEAEYQKYLEHYPSHCQTSPEREQAEREFRENVDQALNELPPATQEVYRLHLSGLPHKEIAARLNLDSGYTRVAVNRASRRVREKLADWAPLSYGATNDDARPNAGAPCLGSSGKESDA